MSHTARSTWPRLFTAACTMRSFMRCMGLCMPGVSSSTIWPSGGSLRWSTARIRLRVVCGLSETIATFWPTSRFTSVDLPTLGRPTMATNPKRNERSVPASAPIRAQAPDPHPVHARALGVGDLHLEAAVLHAFARARDAPEDGRHQAAD